MTDPTPAPRVAVVIGSTRPARICPGIAGWAQRVLAQTDTVSYELLDLAAVDLPLLDEPLMAALGDYRNAHTQAWSRLVSAYDGFIWVFPQYNWGYPAVVKNAIDYLYEEWRDKPASTVTYGTRGGNLGADQLRQILMSVHMQPLDTRVELRITREDLDADWQLKDLEATMAPYLGNVRELAGQMSAALRQRVLS
ncbi:MAG TPA: NADPH-dependent FMN reductase [Solirubrobacteraceae bacterium]|nr:NADPH-dependent FMN reductase [Solirubrobacteraceae bacterium]